MRGFAIVFKQKSRKKPNIENMGEKFAKTVVFFFDL
jgi:hypothetical protein